MNNMGQTGVGRYNIVEKSSAYISLLQDLLPLFALAFSILFVKGLAGLRSSFMGKTFLARFMGVIISSALGGAFAVGCALMLPLFDKQSDPAIMLGVVVFVAIAGVKIVDGLLYKKLGVHFIDVSNSDSADSFWMGMSQKERQECMDSWRKSHEEDNNE